MGKGHSSDSSGRGPEIANPAVQQRLIADINQYANAFGLTLSQEEINQVLDKVFPSSAQFSGVSYDAGREAAYQKAVQFIVPNLQQFALKKAQNPNIPSEQAAQNQADVTRVFQQTLGRDPTQDEISFFGKEIAQGISPYEIGQSLLGSPEYQKTQADIQQQKYDQKALEARNALDQQLQTTGAQVFQKALPKAISAYMKAGRLDSSGLNSALANAQAEIEKERQLTLANAGYQQAVQGAGYNQQNFVNSTANAFQNYLNQSAPFLQQRANVQGLANNIRYGGAAQNILQRQNDLADYAMQANDYSRYLSQQRGPSGISGFLQGALAGGTAGSRFGGWGALTGGLLGGAAGYGSTRY